MIKKLLKQLFNRESSDSRNEATSRLKLILAHDRSTLNASLLEKMRKEILGVVSRYVELDIEGMEFSIKTDSKITALIANLPIRRILQSDNTSAY
nr:septum-site determining protein [Cryptomonas borealis]